MNDTAYDARGYTDGGAQAHFSYSFDYGTGSSSTLYAYGSAIYEWQNGNFYNGYFYTDEANTNWTVSN